MMTDLASITPQSLGRDPMVGLRLARVDGFEPAIALGQDELPAYLRRFTMLFADDATMRRGGIGRVTRAVNAQGEAVALKQLILPTRDEFDDDAAHEALVAKFKAAFREEYECHRALSGLKGFPRLYGWGEVDGVLAIVMEWVEGETLARLRSRLAVDDAGRLSPLVAARLGRDLFDLLCRMSLVGEGFVHRDISPANIMVRTARLPLDRQLAEGTFDLCLIDFGSSLALEPASAVAGTGGKASFTERYATLRRATVAYAPPEMLTDDIPDLRALRMSPAIDVYAAASTVYELIAGVAPYEAAPGTSGASGSRKRTRDIASPYRLKMDTRPDYPIGAHAPGCDLTQLLRREPDVALAAAEQAQQLGLEPDSEELRDALAFVDAQLFDVVMACLSSHQKDRPEPAAVEAALSAFCDHYAQNVGRSLRGEPLTPCPMDASGRAVRRALMVGATVVCGVVWAVVVVSAALLASGARVTATLGSLLWSGTLPGIIAALALALPGIAGVTAGALARNRRSGFLQGVLALSACEVPVLVVAACSVFSQRAVMGGLVVALVATYTLTWFLLAMGFAFELPVSAPRRTKAQMATPLADGRSPQSRAADRSWVSRFIVRAPVGTLQQRYFAEYGTSAARIMSQLALRQRNPMDSTAVINMVCGPAGEPMVRALEECHQDTNLYRNALDRLSQAAELMPAERAEAVLVLFVAVGCSADVRSSVNYAIDYAHATCGGGTSTPRSLGMSMTAGEREPAPAHPLGLLRVQNSFVVSAPRWIQPSEQGVEIGALATGEGDITDVGDDVSARHAHIWCDAQNIWHVEDLSSTNGTVVVNGATRVCIQVEPGRSAQLNPGDELKLGESTTYAILFGAL